jgi:hypothetical protein
MNHFAVGIDIKNNYAQYNPTMHLGNRYNKDSTFEKSLCILDHVQPRPFHCLEAYENVLLKIVNKRSDLSRKIDFDKYFGTNELKRKISQRQKENRILAKNNLLTIAKKIISHKHPEDSPFDPIVQKVYLYNGCVAAVCYSDKEMAQIFLESSFDPYFPDNKLFEANASNTDKWFGPMVIEYHEKPRIILKYLILKHAFSDEKQLSSIQSIICNIWQLCNDHVENVQEQAKKALSPIDRCAQQ